MGRQRVERWDRPRNSGGLWLTFLCVGKRRGYRIVWNKEFLLILAEKQTLISVVEAKCAFHSSVVTKDATLILRLHCLWSRRRCGLRRVCRRARLDHSRPLRAHRRSHNQRQ